MLGSGEISAIVFAIMELQASDTVAQWSHVPQDSHECNPTQNCLLI